MTGQVAGWSYGAQEVSVIHTPELKGTVSASGELSLTLPGTLPSSALKGIYPMTEGLTNQEKMENYVFCGKGLVHCPCTEGFTVTPPTAKFALQLWLKMEMENPEAMDPGDEIITDVLRNNGARLYADVDVQVKGACESGSDKHTFDLDLKAGWNMIEFASTSTCVEPDPDYPENCLQYLDASVVKSTSAVPSTGWLLDSVIDKCYDEQLCGDDEQCDENGECIPYEENP